MDENSVVPVVETNPQTPILQAPIAASAAAPRNKRTKLIIASGAIVAVLIIAVGGFMLFHQNNKASAIKEVDTQYYLDNYKGAAEAAKKGLQNYPNDPVLLKRVIDSNSSQGNITGQEKELFEQSKPYIENALKAYPNDSEMLLSVGYAYESAGDYKEALKYYEKAITLNPKSGISHYHRGHILEFMEQKTKALAEYEKAYELEPENALVLMGKGRVAASKNDAENAFQFFKKASEAKNISLQTKAEALTSAALARESQIIHMKEATNLAYNAVTASPHFSPALGAYGHLLSINGNPKDGMYYINLAIKENRRIALNYWHGGVVLRANKNNNDAIRYLNVAIEKVPNDNTLIGYNTKKRTLALLYYDLARTYFIVDKISPYIMQSLKYAVASDPSVKSKIKSDHDRYNVFTGLETNPEFAALIK